MYLIFDTETTGFPQKNLAADDPSQARIVQFACLVLDSEFNERGVFSTLIKPDGWTIPSHVSAIHGITTEACEDFGIPIKQVVEVFMQYAWTSELVIAHNVKFDRQMLDIELGQCMMSRYITPEFCTMQATTNICKLPGKVPGQYKWPKLQEAYRHLFKEELVGAHDALVDVRACARIFKHLRQEGVPSKCIPCAD